MEGVLMGSVFAGSVLASSLLAWTVTAVAVGAGLALAYLAVVRRASARAELRGHGYTLVVIASVYVVFALAGDPGWLDLELFGVAFFGAIAWAGTTRDPIWLAAGWAAHVLWDVLLPGGPSAAFVPTGYPALCIGFDLVVAVYLLAHRRRLAAG